jgi:hypothetical protein
MLNISSCRTRNFKGLHVVIDGRCKHACHAGTEDKFPVRRLSVRLYVVMLADIYCLQGANFEIKNSKWSRACDPATCNTKCTVCVIKCVSGYMLLKQLDVTRHIVCMELDVPENHRVHALVRMEDVCRDLPNISTAGRRYERLGLGPKPSLSKEEALHMQLKVRQVAIPADIIGMASVLSKMTSAQLKWSTYPCTYPCTFHVLLLCYFCRNQT